MSMIEHPIDFVFDATTLTAISSISENGYITDVLIVVPNYTNTINTTIDIKTKEGYTLWTSGLKAQNATYRIPDPFTDTDKEDIPCRDNYTVTCTLSGAAGGSADKTVKVRLFIKANKR